MADFDFKKTTAVLFDGLCATRRSIEDNKGSFHAIPVKANLNSSE